jgi:hypothetical protein
MAKELSEEEIGLMQQQEQEDENLQGQQVRDRFQVATFVVTPQAPDIKKKMLENKDRMIGNETNIYVPLFQTLTKELKLGNIKQAELEIMDLQNDLISESQTDGLDEYTHKEKFMLDSKLLLSGSLGGETQKQVLQQLKETKQTLKAEKQGLFR